MENQEEDRKQNIILGKRKLKKFKRANEFRSFTTQNITSTLINKIVSDFYKKTSDISKISTRKASQLCLDSINNFIDNTIGGSTDLTPSNNTKSKDLSILNKTNFDGRYIHYGVREHGMAAIMNGLSLHSGFIPYGGTFLVFLIIVDPQLDYPL